MPNSIKINRAPVLTLWAAVVAERLGFDRPTALTLGQAVAGLSAYAKGVSLGIIEPRPELVRERGDRLAEGEQLHVDLLGRAVPVVRTPDGLRAVSKGKPGNPARIEKYLAGKFGERLEGRGRPWPSWRQPMSRPTSTAAGSGCTSSSGPASQRASRAGAPRASWISTGCEAWRGRRRVSPPRAASSSSARFRPAASPRSWSGSSRSGLPWSS